MNKKFNWHLKRKIKNIKGKYINLRDQIEGKEKQKNKINIFNWCFDEFTWNKQQGLKFNIFIFNKYIEYEKFF